MARFGQLWLVCLLSCLSVSGAWGAEPKTVREKSAAIAPVTANTEISSDQFGIILSTPSVTAFRYPTVSEAPSFGSVVATPTVYTASLGVSAEGVSGNSSIIATPAVYVARLQASGDGVSGSAAVLSTPVVYASRLQGSDDGSTGIATVFSTPVVNVQRALADFEQSLDPFTIYDRASSATWSVETRAGQTGAFIYNLGSNAAADDWLIGPPVLLSTDGGGQLAFDYYQEFTDTLAAPLQVLVSTNYSQGDPTAAAWTDVTPATLATSASGAWTQISNISLAQFTGATVRVAFRYRSSGVNSGQCKRIGIDNVYVYQNLYLPPDITSFTADGTEITNGAVFHKDVTLAVTAQNLSRVGKAQFFCRPAGTTTYTEIGEDDNPSDGLTCLWPLSQSPDGAYELLVQLSNGSKHTDRTNQVSVVLSAPSAPQIVSPVSPASTATATGHLTISSDPNVLLNVYLNGALAQTLRPTATTFPLDLDLIEGLNTIYATAENRAGPSASSNVLKLTRERVQPVLHLSLTNNLLMEGDVLSGEVFIDKALTTALTVTISTSQANRINAGPPVTIAAGQTRAPFTITGLQNRVIEPTLEATLAASSPGAVSAQEVILIGDDDRPSLQLLVDHSVVMENAGPNAITARLKRQPASDSALTLQITCSDPKLVPPPTVTIPASATEVTFPIGVVDNAVADGPRSVTLQAQLSMDGELLVASNQVTLQVADDEGPTLTLQSTKSYLIEGNNANIVVRRDGASVTSDLRVSIATNDPTHLRATVATVTIPAGSTDATFTVEAPVNTVAEGSLPQSIIVSALGFSPGELVLNVTDNPLPDLVVETPDAPPKVAAQTKFDINYQIANLGAKDTAGEYVQRIYLSRDKVLDESTDLLLGETRHSDVIPPSYLLNDTVNVRAPLETGLYWIIVKTDALQSIDELVETNNILVFPAQIEVSVPYTAQVGVDKAAYPVNAPIPIHGSATKVDGTPAANVAVNVHIVRGATDRVLNTTTDAQGLIVLTWQPLKGESGDYSIGAVHPGYSTAPAQAAFTILNFDASFSTDITQVDEGGSLTWQGTLHNPSAFALTGLTATVLGAPAGLQINVTLPGTVLGAGQTFGVPIQVIASPGYTGSGTVTVRITTAEGVTLDIPVRVYVRPLAAQLAVTPSTLEATVVRGQQKTLTLALHNIGSAATDNLMVALSPASWISLASPAAVPAIAPGASATVSVQLTPPTSQALTVYQGSVVVYSTQRQWAQIPFSFRVVSDAKGGFEAEIVDEYTFFAAGAPNVAGATVTLRDPITSQEVATLHTSVDGKVQFPSVTEGWYAVEVSAPNHTSSRGNYYLSAGQTNYRKLFVSLETVHYTWRVEQADIDDRYLITVQSTFETNVPVPVITVTPPQIDVSDLTDVGQSKVVNLVIENHGLIAAQKGRFNFGEHPFYSFEPLITDVGTISAASSITVPIVVRCVGNFGTGGAVNQMQQKQTASPRTGAITPQDPIITDAPCFISAGFNWAYPCGNLDVEKITAIAISGVLGHCPHVTLPQINIPWPTWTPPPRDPGDPTDPTSPVSPQSDGPGPGSNQASGPNNGSIVPPVVTSTINYSPPTSCDCHATTSFQMSTVYDLTALAHSLADKLGSTIPIYIEDVSVPVDFDASGGLCCDGLGLVHAEGSIGGRISATFSAGKAIADPIVFDKSAAGFTNISCNVTGFVGGKGTIGGNAKFESKLGCDLSWTRCATGSLDGQLNLSGAITVSATALGPHGEQVTGTLRGTVTANGYGQAWIADCKHDKGLAAKGYQYGACGSFAGTASVSGTFEYQAADGTTIKTSVTLGGTLDSGKLGHCVDEVTGGSSGISGTNHARRATRSGAIGTNDADGGSIDLLPESTFALSPQQIYDRLVPSSTSGVCAHVKIQLDQQAVITRSAFKATLELDNSSPTTTLTNVGFTLDVRDANGNAVPDLFGIPTPEITGLDSINGSGTLAPSSSGTVKWTLIPTDQAAPQQDTVYYVGGSIQYVENGTQVSIPVIPTAITVKPDAALYLIYFHQRDVLGDDPNTPAIEPSVPYSLALTVENRGAGTARNLRITSAQPQIVDNEKGLFIDFRVIGAQVDGGAVSPSLTASLGDIAPGARKNVTWQLVSSLQGLFIDYKATFEHLDGLNDPRLSLIKGVEIHELIHTVKSLAPGSDGLPDYLVNDIADFNSYPDTIYFSEGGTAPVKVLERATTTGALTGNSPTVVLQGTFGTGWTYLRVPDPANGAYRLTRVTRSDGLEIPIGTNVWTTDRTFVGRNQPAVRENILHLLDYNSTGQYTLTYQAVDPQDTTPPRSSMATLPADSNNLIPLQWSGTDNRGVASYDIYASVDNGPWQLWLGKTASTIAVYSGTLGHQYAFYSIARDTAGNVESSKSTAEATTRVSLTNYSPVLNAVPNQAVAAGSTFEYQLTATDPDGPKSALRFSVSSDRPGVSVDAIKGILRWVTGKGDGGTTATVTVTVTDTSVPAGIAQRQFSIAVVATNTAPSLAYIPSQFCEVGSILTLIAQATDTDIPAQTITYRLGLGAPASMTIDASSGLIRWSPTLDDARKHYLVEVTATDNGTPSLSTKQVFALSVGGNHVPFAGTDYLSTDQGKPVSISAKKLLLNDTDADGDLLTITLMNTASVQGGSVLFLNGTVTYTPLANFVGADSFAYWISDNNGGVAAGTVAVTVRAPGAQPANAIVVTRLANGSMQLNMVGIPGRNYVVQVSDDLTNWANLATLKAGQNGLFQFTDADAVNHTARFYRLALP